MLELLKYVCEAEYSLMLCIPSICPVAIFISNYENGRLIQVFSCFVCLLVKKLAQTQKSVEAIVESINHNVGALKELAAAGCKYKHRHAKH